MGERLPRKYSQPLDGPGAPFNLTSECLGSGVSQAVRMQAARPGTVGPPARTGHARDYGAHLSIHSPLSGLSKVDALIRLAVACDPLLHATYRGRVARPLAAQDNFFLLRVLCSRTGEGWR